MAGVINLANVVTKFVADTTSFDKNLGKSVKAAESAGKRMQSVGRTLTTAATLPLVGVGVAATKMASDAEEAANKFDVVMGDSAGRVRDRLEELHDTIPLTTHEMESMAAGVQDLLVPMGLARGNAADMSAEMVKLAGDIASFNNVDPTRALDALRSGLAGESEPLRRFGVDVRKTRLQTIALNEGLIDSAEQFDTTAQAQALMIAVQRDSADAIGDAARTADSAANSFRFFWREVKELGVIIGRVLLPHVTPMVQRMAAALAMFQGLSPAAQKFVVALGAITAAAGPVLLALGTFMRMLPAIKAGIVALGTPTAGTIGLAVLAIGALVAAGVALVDNWSIIKYEVKRLVQGVRTWMVDRFQAIVEKVRAKVDAVTGFFKDMYEKVVGGSYVPDMVRDIGSWMGRLDSRMTSVTKSAVDQTAGAFARLATEGSADFGRLAKSIIADVTRMATKMLFLKGLFRIFGAALNPAVATDALSSGVFMGIPGLARGGPARRGEPYVVGEQGPELFVPSQSGRVVPNGAGGSGIAAAIERGLSNMPAPRSPFEAARDADYQEMFRELARVARDDGFSFQGA